MNATEKEKLIRLYMRLEIGGDGTLPLTDWSQCPDVERSAGTLHGAWRVKGHRVPVRAILANAAAGCSAEQIATEIFDLPVDVVRRILAFRADPPLT